MVSTRGGARTGADEPTAPPRATTTKKASQSASTTTATAPPAKGRTTRSKKEEARRHKEQGMTDDESGSTQPTTRGARRVPRNDQAESAVHVAEKTTRPATIPRSAATVPAKAKVVTASQPSLKPAASRATRATRATAAKEKAQPLSPKKITQVSRTTSKGPKTEINVKKAAPTKSNKTAAVTRALTGRKRTVSDENAEISSDDEEADEIQVAVCKPLRLARAAAKHEPIAHRSPVRNSTKAKNQPPQAQQHDEDIHGEHTIQSEQSVIEDLEDEESADELSGPKTPIRRATPKATGHSESGGRSESGAQRAEVRTPLRFRALLGSQYRTPHTQKPYCKPLVDMDPLGAMTVARAQTTAMVFPSLEAMVEAEQQEPSALSEDADEDRGSSGSAESSRLLSSVAAPIDDANASPRHEESGLIMMEDCSAPEESFLTGRVPSIAYSWDSGDENEVEDEESTLLVDQEETIVAPDEADHDGEDTSSAASDDDDTVIVSRSLRDEDDSPSDLDDSMDNTDMFEATPLPQTMVWDNIQQDPVIAIDFDTHLDLARVLPEVEPTERLSIVPGVLPVSNEPIPDIVSGSRPNKLLDGVISNDVGRRSSYGIRQSLDATVNLSDFFDVASLSETPEVTRSAREQTRTIPLNDIDALNSPGAATLPATPTMFLSPSKADTVHRASPRYSHGYVFSTPVSERATTGEEEQVQEPAHLNEPPTPHYALPTVASASRRKSLPNLGFQHTPVHAQARPNTSDGHSMPRLRLPLDMTFWQAKHKLAKDSDTPDEHTGQTPVTVTPGRKRKFSQSSTVKKRTHLESIEGDHEHLSPIAKRTRTPKVSQSPLIRPSSSGYQISPARSTKRMSNVTTPVRTVSSRPSTAKSERFLSLPARRLPMQHANTVMVPSRFRTPLRMPAKRPASAHKTMTVRKIALKGSTPSHSPLRTPLRDVNSTPGTILMTPHPAAPLKSVVALVEIFTNDGAPASAAFVALLHRLGAKTTRSWSDRITHVVWKEGSPATLQKLRQHNKGVANDNAGTTMHCVNSRWITDCEAEGRRMDETDDGYLVDVGDLGRTSKRRRKSMEPSTLMNVGGNVMRDRKSSLGRNSLRKISPAAAALAALGTVSPDDQAGAGAEKENSVVSEEDQQQDSSSPLTPAYLAAPDSLVQQTAPLHKIRKLDLQARAEAKNRRLTYWTGGH